MSEKDKEHYMPGNLEDRLFASTVVFTYQSRSSIRAPEGS